MPLATTVIVPALPVWSFSGSPEEPVECVTVAPLTPMLPLVETMLLDRLTSFSASTVTLPEPVVIRLLTCTLPVVVVVLA